MRSREFITLLGNTAAWQLEARAQQAKLPTIVFLGLNTPSSQSQWTAAFVQRLCELGLLIQLVFELCDDCRDFGVRESPPQLNTIRPSTAVRIVPMLFM